MTMPPPRRAIVRGLRRGGPVGVSPHALASAVGGLPALWRATREGSRLRHGAAGSRRGAVVLHLFHTEIWPQFARRLAPVLDGHLDLLVTLPPRQAACRARILAACPRARVLTVPNRGRDVLPFLVVARELDRLGYEYVLKLHSKKSAHRPDGAQWLEQILACLVPETQESFARADEILRDRATGLVGPAGQYLSLAVNFAANEALVTRNLRRVAGRECAERVRGRPGQFGFFAGTMFWARLDALRPVLGRRACLRGFAREAGQIDGTQAHALERVLCLAPALGGRALYEMTGDGVWRRESLGRGAVPEWADLRPSRRG